MNKKRITCLLGTVMGLVVLLTAGCWLYYSPDRPNLALLCVLAGGVILFNLLVSLFFISKNFKDKK